MQINQAKRNAVDSPLFPHNFAAILATASFTLTLRDTYPACRKYPVINYLEVVNDDVVNIDVSVDGETYRVPAKNVRTIPKPNISVIRVTNRDAAVASTINMITASFQYKAG